MRRANSADDVVDGKLKRTCVCTPHRVSHVPRRIVMPLYPHTPCGVGWCAGDVQAIRTTSVYPRAHSARGCACGCVTASSKLRALLGKPVRNGDPQQQQESTPSCRACPVELSPRPNLNFSARTDNAMNAAAAGSPSSGPEDLVFTPFPKDRYDRDLSSFFESGEAYVTVDSQHEEDVMGPPCAAPTAIDIRHRRIGSPAAPLELGKRSPQRTDSRQARSAMPSAACRRAPHPTSAFAPSEQQEDLATQPKRQAPAEPPPNSKVIPAAGSTTAEPAETGALAEAPGMAAVVVAPPVRRELRGRSRPPNAPRV